MMTQPAFTLGGKLHLRFLRRQGRAILSSSLWITLVTWLCVTLACGLLTGDWPLALLFGAVATATDPAATETGASAPAGRFSTERPEGPVFTAL